MIKFFSSLISLFQPPAPAADVVVIDQGAYFDSLRSRQRQWEENERLLKLERERIALSVWQWCSSVVAERRKLPLPPRLPRNDIPVWMNGLDVQELFAIATAGRYAVGLHLGGVKIRGVRALQALPPSILRFPAPKPDPEQQQRVGGGGGPRRT